MLGCCPRRGPRFWLSLVVQRGSWSDRRGADPELLPSRRLTRSSGRSGVNADTASANSRHPSASAGARGWQPSFAEACLWNGRGRVRYERRRRGFHLLGDQDLKAPQGALVNATLLQMPHRVLEIEFAGLGHQLRCANRPSQARHSPGNGLGRHPSSKRMGGRCRQPEAVLIESSVRQGHWRPRLDPARDAKEQRSCDRSSVCPVLP
jgi:hypothetical protein